MSRKFAEKCECGVYLNEDESIFCEKCGVGPFCFSCYSSHSNRCSNLSSKSNGEDDFQKTK